MLMSPNERETAVHGCHCPGDSVCFLQIFGSWKIDHSLAVWGKELTDPCRNLIEGELRPTN